MHYYYTLNGSECGVRGHSNSFRQIAYKLKYVKYDFLFQPYRPYIIFGHFVYCLNKSRQVDE